ncbi:hypothetical protein [Hymenobacter terrenus]|uniref:hypothetical protein n=1 Tax=Hymenobacter terrenus TaxID=1629124 RepID=UPI0006197168|nr:hypothetical protein [Hymenobacter terrenus]
MPSLPTGRLLLACLLLAGCSQKTETVTEHPAKNQLESHDLLLRQALIQTLARHIRQYHADDAKAAQPGWDGIYSFSNGPGRDAKTYNSRAAVRAELNRMLDSLKATGPLQMGNAADDTDTISSPAASNDVPTAAPPAAVSPSTEEDSGAVFQVRKPQAPSTAAPL